MADYLKDYFKRDLSEAELDKLEALLEDEGKALQLLRGAKKRYEATGLPDPLHKPGFWQRWGFSSARAWTAALATLLLIVLLPVALRQPPVAPAPQMATNQPAAKEQEPQVARAKKKAVLRAAPQASGYAMKAEAKDSLQSNAGASAAGAPASAAPAMAAADYATAPEAAAPMRALLVRAPRLLSVSLLKSGPDWSFALVLPKNAHVVARIVDAKQAVKRLLWDADMQAGSTALAWDGKDSQGLALAPGAYTLEVISPDSKAVLKLNLP